MEKYFEDVPVLTSLDDYVDDLKKRLNSICQAQRDADIAWFVKWVRDNSTL